MRTPVACAILAGVLSLSLGACSSSSSSNSGASSDASANSANSSSASADNTASSSNDTSGGAASKDVRGNPLYPGAQSGTAPDDLKTNRLKAAYSTSDSVATVGGWYQKTLPGAQVTPMNGNTTYQIMTGDAKTGSYIAVTAENGKTWILVSTMPT